MLKIPIFKLIKTILVYYNSNRGVGHTALMIRGLEHYDKKALIVVKNFNHMRRLEKKFPNHKIITLDRFNTDLLLGYDIPIIFDNAAIVELLERTYEHIKLLNQELNLKDPFEGLENSIITKQDIDIKSLPQKIGLKKGG
jgi:hypothetical protein